MSSVEIPSLSAKYGINNFRSYVMPWKHLIWSQWPSDNTSQERKHLIRIASMDRAVKTGTESKNVVIFKTIVCTYTATMFAAAYPNFISFYFKTHFLKRRLRSFHCCYSKKTRNLPINHGDMNALLSIWNNCCKCILDSCFVKFSF